MGQIRIIGGRWKRTPLSVQEGEGLRPTPDRVRETLFNWLGQNLSGWRCLDLFAGSGALGFEAGSRGAEQVVFVERHPPAIRAIASLITKLGADDRLRAVQADAFDWLTKGHDPTISERFDLIFLDPPFGEDLLPQVVPKALARLANTGLIYMESQAPITAAQAQEWGLELIRADKAGMVHYHLLTPKAMQGAADVDSSLSGDI